MNQVIDELINYKVSSLVQDAKRSTEIEWLYKAEVKVKPLSVPAGKSVYNVTKLKRPKFAKKNASKNMKENLKESSQEGEQDSKLTLESYIHSELPGLKLPPSLETYTSVHDREERRRNIKRILTNKPVKSKNEIVKEEKQQRVQLLQKHIYKHMDHQKKLDTLKDNLNKRNFIKGAIRDEKIRTNRCKQYYEEFQVQKRSKMMKISAEDELIYKKLVNKGKEMQKKAVQDSYKQERETAKVLEKQKEFKEASIENFYLNKLMDLEKNITEEKFRLKAQMNSQLKELESIRRENKQKLKSEIRNLQEEIVNFDRGVVTKDMADKIYSNICKAQYIESNIICK